MPKSWLELTNPVNSSKKTKSDRLEMKSEDNHEHLEYFLHLILMESVSRVKLIPEKGFSGFLVSVILATRYSFMNFERSRKISCGGVSDKVHIGL